VRSYLAEDNNPIPGIPQERRAMVPTAWANEKGWMHMTKYHCLVNRPPPDLWIEEQDDLDEVSSPRKRRLALAARAKRNAPSSSSKKRKTSNDSNDDPWEE